MNAYVVVNFLSKVIFIFLLFQLHKHTLYITKEKQKLLITWDKKLTTTYMPNVECMKKEYESILIIFCIIIESIVKLIA